MAAVILRTPEPRRFRAAKYAFIWLGIPHSLYVSMRASLFRRGTIEFEIKGQNYRIDVEAKET